MHFFFPLFAFLTIRVHICLCVCRSIFPQAGQFSYECILLLSPPTFNFTPPVQFLCYSFLSFLIGFAQIIFPQLTSLFLRKSALIGERASGSWRHSNHIFCSTTSNMGGSYSSLKKAAPATVPPPSKQPKQSLSSAVHNRLVICLQ